MKNIVIAFTFICLFNLGCKRKNAETKDRTALIEGSQIVESSSGVAINYTVTGQGDHALLFVHGWSCDQTYWNEQVKHFKDKYQVVTIDLGGHGKSGLNRDDWSMMSFGSDVLAVIDKLDFKTLSIIGHSMGSVVAMNVASRVEKQLQAVVFVDFFKNKPSALPTKDEAVQRTAAFKGDFVNSTKGFVRNMFLPSSDSLLVDRTVTDMSSANPEVAVPAIIDMMMTDTGQGFNTLVSKKMNAHLINSDRRPVDVSYFDSLGIKAHSIAETGHFLMIEKSNDFNLLLEEIISN